MKLLSISQVKAGMRTAKPIADRAGAQLAAAGIELTETMIERLKSRRIEFVYVEDDRAEGAAAPEAEFASREAQIDQAVDRMFAGLGDNPVMAALAEAGRRYRKGKLR